MPPLNEAMFQYKSDISSLTDGQGFVLAQRNKGWAIITSIGKSYTIYDLSNLNTVEKGPEQSDSVRIGAFGRFAVTLSKEGQLAIYSRGAQIVSVELQTRPVQMLSIDTEIYLASPQGIERVSIESSLEGELDTPGQKITVKTEVLEGLVSPKGDKEEIDITHMVQIGQSKLLAIIANQSMLIYNPEKKKTVYCLSCTPFIGATDIAQSVSPSILAVSLPKEVLIIDIKKDQIRQCIPLAGVHSLAFRTDVLGSKELVAATATTLHRIDLEKGLITAKMSLPGCKTSKTNRARTYIRFVPGLPFLVVAQANGIQVFDFRSKMALLKRRAGVVFSQDAVATFFRDTLVVATNEKVYALSLRKETQSKEIANIDAKGEPVAISAAKGHVLVTFKQSVHTLEETVGGLAKKKNLAEVSKQNYLSGSLSACRESAIMIHRESPTEVRVLAMSLRSGFLHSTFTAAEPLASAMDFAGQTIHLLYETQVLSFTTSSGQLSSTITIPACAMGTIISSFRELYYVTCSSTTLYFIQKSGTVLRALSKQEGSPLLVRTTKNSKWVYVLTALDNGQSVLEIFDIETATRLTQLHFPNQPKNILISPNNTSLVVITDRILLYSNTAIIQSTPASTQSLHPGTGIQFEPQVKSRLRLFMDYNRQANSKTELDKLGPLDMLNQENIENLPAANYSADIPIQALLETNCPISKIISYLKEVSDPTTLLTSLTQQLETHYNISEVLINRLLHFRRKDIDLQQAQEAIQQREGTTERLINLYLSVLSLSQ
ncbi:hypothetical protein NEHOM01_1981 [Nematocida homosporus]|uniref:uncharacterized protein n=1 Tax=Nematocida homosporus TaxID=1912981 RepID=UPI002220E8C3|nr:uncharacterized protein NEHOM01_1981 [Nematocida homosporus]KAI5187172.1 hypothetical protein NEHOM01_1981 [Nematocida homosporus]